MLTIISKFQRLRAYNTVLYFISFISIGFIIYCLNPVELGLKKDEARVILDNDATEQQTKPAIFDKVQEMNARLENIRMLILKSSNFSGPILNLPQTTVVYESNPHYFEIIKHFSCVTNINLTWNKVERQYLLHFNKIFNSILKFSDDSQFEVKSHQWLLNDKYYRFTGSQLLCDLTKNGSFERYGYTNNFLCNTDIKLASTSTQIEPYYLKSQGPIDYAEGASSEMPKNYQVMQIFTRSIISDLGEPLCGGIQIKPNSCQPNASSIPNAAVISTLPYYREVFVITQRWGEEYYHRLIENVPRTVLFLEFLRKYPTLKILASAKSQKLFEILETLGLSRDRVVKGWIRTDIAYVPRTTFCGIPNVLELQFFQHYNHHFITRNILVRSDIKRKNLILIKRSGKRKFQNHNLIERLLNRTSNEFGFNFVVFRDNPPPSMKETMTMFSLASIVVAPHGAGLSNLVFGRPGTLVIEGLCNMPHTYLCFQRTAYALGMRWHGMPTTSGCFDMIDVDGKEIDSVLRSYIRIISPGVLQS